MLNNLCLSLLFNYLQNIHLSTTQVKCTKLVNRLTPLENMNASIRSRENDANSSLAICDNYLGTGIGPILTVPGGAIHRNCMFANIRQQYRKAVKVEDLFCVKNSFRK